MDSIIEILICKTIQFHAGKSFKCKPLSFPPRVKFCFNLFLNLLLLYLAPWHLGTLPILRARQSTSFSRLLKQSHSTFYSISLSLSISLSISLSLFNKDLLLSPLPFKSSLYNHVTRLAFLPSGLTGNLYFISSSLTHLMIHPPLLLALYLHTPP